MKPNRPEAPSRATFPSLAGEWAECGEGGPQAGGEYDPAGREQPHGEGCHGGPQPGDGGGA